MRPTTVVGGLLWMAHGPLTMLQPLGPDVTYSEARGYSLVADPVAFLLYNVPGSLALVLSAAGAIEMLAPATTGERARGLPVRPLLVGASASGSRASPERWPCRCGRWSMPCSGCRTRPGRW